MTTPPRKPNPLGDLVNGLLTAAVRGAAQGGADFLEKTGKRAIAAVGRFKTGVDVATQLCGRCSHPRYEHVKGRCPCGCPEFVDVTVTPPPARGDGWRDPR